METEQYASDLDTPLDEIDINTRDSTTNADDEVARAAQIQDEDGFNGWSDDEMDQSWSSDCFAPICSTETDESVQQASHSLLVGHCREDSCGHSACRSIRTTASDRAAVHEMFTTLAHSVIPGYAHTPLDFERGEIRLVKILPRSSGDTYVQCHIKHVFLESKPEFLTLSYTWGTPEAAEDILINGENYSVRQNLLDFLRKAQVEFADQLCQR